MTKMRAGLGGNTGAVLAGAAMAVLLALGGYIGFGAMRQPAVRPQEAVDVTPPAKDAPLTQQRAASVDEPTQDADAAIRDTAPSASAAKAPSFDELRRDPDGTTVIAGRAAPHSEVSILVDGKEVARATTDSAGGFAALTSLPAKPGAQIVTLEAKDGEDTVGSLDEIILAPTAAVEETTVAELTPDPAAEPIEPTPGPVAEEVVENTPSEQSDTAAIAQVSQEPSIAIASADGEATPEDDALKQETTPEPAPLAALPPTAPETADVAVPSPDPAPSAPEQAPRIAVLKSDAQGVSLLQPARPEAMSRVALDTIGYSDAGNVQLSGRAQTQAVEVRIYLDNRAVISLPVGAGGRWRADLPGVDEGIYTLRVDEVTAEGAVSSRIETPFKRESAETLAQASAQSEGPISAITVQKGATLWAIARDRYGDGTLYVRVFEANADSIRDPDLIYPGQVFDLPQ